MHQVTHDFILSIDINLCHFLSIGFSNYMRIIFWWYYTISLRTTDGQVRYVHKTKASSILYTRHEWIYWSLKATPRLSRQIKDTCCPCCDYQNHIVFQVSNTIRLHLVRWGFLKNYTIWTITEIKRRIEASNHEGHVK